MGVRGLWDLASPAGQRVDLSALENKVVAVDASIWMYHFLKAMRDEDGNMQKGAHLLGFFRRICRLLYLKIRPVFVFDGKPPALKMSTLQQRANLRFSEERKRRKTVEKLLQNRLKQHILNAAGEGDTTIEANSTASAASASATISHTDDVAPTSGADHNTDVADDADVSSAHSSDVEEAPAPPAEPSTGSRRWERQRWRRQKRVPEPFQGFMAKRRGLSEVVLPELPAEPLREILEVPHRKRTIGRMREPDEWKGYVLEGGGMVTIPLDGPVSLEDFEGLPAKVKYTLLQRAQEAWYGESRLKAVEAKDDMGAFVNVQLETFLRHIRTNKEIEKVKRKMAEEVARPAGDGIAEGDSYMPPSWLTSARSEPAIGTTNASNAASSSHEPFGAATSVSSRDSGRGRGRGNAGRGRHGGIRQLDGQELSRLRPLADGELTQPTELLEGIHVETHEAPASTVLPSSAAPQLHPISEETDAVQLFGTDFFAARSDEDSENEADHLAKQPPLAETERPFESDGESHVELGVAEELGLESKEVERQLLTLTDDTTDSLQDDIASPALRLHPDSSDDSSCGGEHIDVRQVESTSAADVPARIAEQRVEEVSCLSDSEFVGSVESLGRRQAETVDSIDGQLSYDIQHQNRTCLNARQVQNVLHSNTTENGKEAGATKMVDSRTNNIDETERSLPSVRTFPSTDDTLKANQTSATEDGRSTEPMKTAGKGDECKARKKNDDAVPIDPTSLNSTASPSPSKQIKLAKAATSAPLPPRPGVRVEPGNTSATDTVWCTTHFQYRWRCRQDGISSSCDAGCASRQPRRSEPAHQASNASVIGRADAADRTGDMNNGNDEAGNAGERAANIDSDLADEDLEELEFGRLREQLDDERRELIDDLHRSKQRSDTVTPEMQRDVETLLEAFGIPFVHAPAEAEAQCAFLVEAKLVDAVATDDSDVLVFGAPEVYRRLFSEDHLVECYAADRLQARLGLVQGDLIALAMLLGCDYTLGVHGVGIVNALEIVRAFAPGRLGPGRSRSDAGREDWMQELTQLKTWAQNVADWDADPRDADTNDRQAVKIFKQTHRNFRTQWSFPSDFPSVEVHNAFCFPAADRSLEPFTWGKVDDERVIRQLSCESGLNEEKVRERLDPALRRYTDTLRQPRITEYMRPVSSGEVALVRSVRMQEALRGLRGEEVSSSHVDTCEPAGTSAQGRRRRRAPQQDNIVAGLGGAENVENNLSGVSKRRRKTQKSLAQPHGVAAQSAEPSAGWQQLRCSEVVAEIDLDAD